MPSNTNQITRNDRRTLFIHPRAVVSKNTNELKTRAPGWGKCQEPAYPMCVHWGLARGGYALCLLFIRPRAPNLIDLRSAGTMPA